MVEGWVTEVTGTPESSKLTIRVHAISGVSPSETPRFVRLSERGTTDLLPGRFVRCFASVNTPPVKQLPTDYDFERDAYFKRLSGVGFTFGDCRVGTINANERSEALFDRTSISALRRDTAEHIATRAGQSGGLAAALMTGDRSFLAERDQEALRGAGLAHLLAISGLHMGLAAGVFYVLTFRALVLVEPLAIRFPCQKIASLTALMAITWYLVLSGASVSAQRAYVMAACGLLAVIFDRPVLSLQTLAVAMIAVLALSPEAVVTPGFQMSFAATAVLIRAYRNTTVDTQKERHALTPVFNTVWTIIKTSLVAGLATLPFALFHFGRAAPLGFIANVVAMPVITFVSVPFAAVSALLMPFGLEAPFLWVLGESLDVVLWAAHALDYDPTLAINAPHVPLPSTSLLLTIVGLSFWVIYGRKMRAALCSLCAIAAMIWWVAPSPTVLSVRSGHLYVRDQDGMWQHIKLSGAGLKPLSAPTALKLKCNDACTILPYGSQGEIVINSNSQTLLSPATKETFQLSSDKSWLAYPVGQRLTFKDIPSRPCRRWSVDWPTCSGILRDQE